LSAVSSAFPLPFSPLFFSAGFFLSLEAPAISHGKRLGWPCKAAKRIYSSERKYEAYVGKAKCSNQSDGSD
jgi:hypothetical protein